MRGLLLAIAVGLAGCAAAPAAVGPDAAGPPPFAGYESVLYAGTAHWLCHPDLPSGGDICRQSLDATVVDARGTTSVERHAAAADPAVDCFYVYPTVSRDPTGNADLDPGDEERYTTYVQAARYSLVCRVFAPVYRQTTFASIFNPSVEGDRDLAYADVLDAFKHYVATENDGRGVLLVGHSQGSSHLTRLIAEVVEEDSALLDRLVGAHLIGSTVAVPEGEAIGGSFDRVPACSSATETGCVVSYVTYRQGDPDLASGAGLFGRPPAEGLEALCVNPGALGGGEATLTPYVPTRRPDAFASVIASEGIFSNGERDADVTTPFYTTPDLVRAACRTAPSGIRYLEARAVRAPDDARAAFGGELQIAPGWGLHFVDMTLAQGTLVELAGRQAAAWADR